LKFLVDVHTLEKEKAGKAFYAESLLAGIAKNKNFEKDEFFLFAPERFEMEFDLPKNFHFIECKKRGIKFHLSLIKEIWSKKYDYFLSLTSFIPVAFGRGKMISIIYDFASWKNDDFKKNRKAEIIEKLLIKIIVWRSSKIITISQNTQKELLQRFPKTSKKSFAIMGSAKEYKKQNPDEDVLKKYNLQKENYFLYVSTLEPRKNLSNTLKAFRKFLNFLKKNELKSDVANEAKFHQQENESSFYNLRKINLNDNFTTKTSNDNFGTKISNDNFGMTSKNFPRYVIAGGKGWYFSEIFKTIEEENLQEDVQFLGYTPNEDLPALFRNSISLLLVPFFEGFGLPVAESISFGKSAITSNTSSLPEVLGNCGIAVDPKNIDEIFEAIKEMWFNEGKRKNFEKETLTWRENFKVDVMGREFEKVLK